MSIPRDANRSQTLLFMALDPENQLLYVCEQSNHRVRCVNLNSPQVMTSSIPPASS